MDAEQLRAMRAPLQTGYQETPEKAVVTLRAKGPIGSAAIACKVATGRALVEAGLHPATGGDGGLACSGDMLLEALVACAGVTLASVATAISFLLGGAPSWRRATSISAVLSAWREMRRWAFAR